MKLIKINILIIFILSVITIIILYLHYKFNRQVLVNSKITNNKYYCRDINNKQQAANLLGEIDKRLNLLRNFLLEQFKDNPNFVKRLKRFKSKNIRESTRFSKSTSYTVNKNTLVMCLRSKQNEQILKDINTLLFVAIHEFTHIVTDSFGHTEDFWENFKYMLKTASEINIYDKQDYFNNPEKYCGIEINSSPLYISNIKAKLT